MKKYEWIIDGIFPPYARIREIHDLVVRSIRRSGIAGRGGDDAKKMKHDIRLSEAYEKWIQKNEPDEAQLKAMHIASTSWSYHPRVSIITPVYNPALYDIEQCINSVLNQVYDNWELCLVDGGSDKSYVKEVIERYAEKDKRIKFTDLDKNLGIARNSNEALKLATGEYVGFLDHDDTLAPVAVFEVVKLLNDHPGTECF